MSQFILNPNLFDLIFPTTILVFLAFVVYFIKRPSSAGLFVKKPPVKKVQFVPVSVNFHFTRKCNYECGFCFHTAKTSHITPLDHAKVGLEKMHKAGMKKLNLSGGEPFLYSDHVGELAKFSKEILKLESFSIVSNGSKITKSFFQKYGQYVDILAISVDSFDENTNVLIGRGKGNHLKQLKNISKWCEEFNVKFKLNSVINRYNVDEDLSQNISILEPFRWKCFQCLSVDSENKGDGAIRDCSRFLISDEEFDDFCKRHEHLKCFVPESNRMMKSSYLILDEYMRFLCKGDVYFETKSILDVSVEEALAETDYEEDIFVKRGGVYEWTRDFGTPVNEGCCSSSSVKGQDISKLEW